MKNDVIGDVITVKKKEREREMRGKMGKEEFNERRKECELRRERKGGEALRKKEMENQKEIKRRFWGKDLERVREIFEEREEDYKINW